MHVAHCTLHADEQEEGEARGDLDDLLSVGPVSSSKGARPKGGRR